MIHILIVNNDPLVSDLLTCFLNRHDGMFVVGQVNTSTAAMHALELQPCDVLLLDLLLNKQGAAVLAGSIARKFPQIQCLVMGALEPDRAALHCLELGAAGYLDSRDTLDDLVAKIRAAAIGETLASPHFAAALITRLVKFKRLATDMNGYHTVRAQDQLLTLTMREQEVFELIGESHSNHQIAGQLMISVGTVKNHVHSILDKLDVHTRRQAAMLAQHLDRQEVNPSAVKHRIVKYSRK